MQSFDSMEELFAAERKAREAADGNVTEVQSEITVGDCVIRYEDYATIYGEILDVVELEKSHYDLDDPEQREDFEDFAQMYGDDWSKSFVFGRFFSQSCPEGELSDAHRSRLHKLPREIFEMAQARSWPPAEHV